MVKQTTEVSGRVTLDDLKEQEIAGIQAGKIYIGRRDPLIYINRAITQIANGETQIEVVGAGKNIGTAATVADGIHQRLNNRWTLDMQFTSVSKPWIDKKTNKEIEGKVFQLRSFTAKFIQQPKR